MVAQSVSGEQHSKNIGFLPSPGKKQPIGFCRFQLFDAARKERFNSGMNRQFEVLVWYPGEMENTQRKEYLSGHNIDKLFFLNHKFGRKKVKEAVSQIKTNSFVEIPVSDYRKRYPVLLFSHDIGMLPEYYSALMEHLASEGYFVFSINHPYLSEACSIDPASTKKNTTVTCKNKIAALSAFLSFRARKLLVGKSYSEKWTISKQLLSGWHSLAKINSDLTLDKSFLLTFLEQLNTKFFNKNSPYSIFSNRMDLSRVGVIGHGWGGTSAVHSIIKDNRIKAAVNLDGFQFCNALNDTIDKPLLMIYSEKYTGINEGIYFCSSDYNAFTIKNSRHNSFTDWPHLSDKNMQDGQALYETLNLVIHFLDRYLKKVDHLSFMHANSK